MKQRINTDWLITILGGSVTEAVEYLQTLPPAATLGMVTTYHPEEDGGVFASHDGHLSMPVGTPEAKAARLLELETLAKDGENALRYSIREHEETVRQRTSAIAEAKAELAALYAGEKT